MKSVGEPMCIQTQMDVAAQWSPHWRCDKEDNLDGFGLPVLVEGRSESRVVEELD